MHTPPVVHCPPVVHHHHVVASPVIRATAVAATPTATLKLDLPADATVVLMGKQMHKAGASRQWSVPLTAADKDHPYEVQVVVGAKKVSHVATLRSGETTRLNVTLNDGNLVVRTSGAADQLAAK